MLPPQLVRQALAALLCAAVSTACGDPLGNSAPGERIIVAAGDSGRLAVLSVPDWQIVARPGPVPVFQDAYALAPDGRTLWFTAFNSLPERTLLALDTRSLTVAGSLTMAELDNRSQVPGLSVVGNFAAVFSPDGTKLLLANAVRSSATGVALLDVATQTPVGFLGPLSVRPDGLAASPPTGAFPAGRIFAIGTRTPDEFPRVDSLFVLDPETLEVLEALFVAGSAGNGLGSLFAVHPAVGGESVYLLGAGRLYLYDLTARRIVSSAPAPQFGSVAVAPGGATVYVTDPGDGRESPGSGLVFVFGPELDVRPPIDLRSESVDGVPPVTHGLAVSPDGSHLYVTSGTGSRGPLFGPQPRRVFVIETTTREVVRVVPLQDYGAGPIFVLAQD